MLFNRERADVFAEKDGFDAIVASTGPNVLYCSGFWSPGLFLGMEHACVLVCRADGWMPRVVTPMGPLDMLADHVPDLEKVYVYGEFYWDVNTAVRLDRHDSRLRELIEGVQRHDSMVRALSAAIKEAGLEKGAIALDQAGLGKAEIDELRMSLPGVRWVGGEQTLGMIRMVKTPEEVRRLRAAVEIAEYGIIAAVRSAKVGVTERELATEFERAVATRGGRAALVTIGFGAKGAHPNSTPSGRTLRRGDLIRFDVGCVYEHYHSDTARTFAFGEPDAMLAEEYATIRAGQESGLAAVKAGVTSGAIFNAVMGEVHGRGLTRCRRQYVGHGIGIEFYDLPSLNRGGMVQLERGMVINVEIPYYKLGVAGMQVEDTLLVTDTGCEVFNCFSRDLVEV